MNSTLIFVLILVTIVMIASIIRTWLEQRKQAPEADRDVDEALLKLGELEERVKVLERIVTEKRYDLKKEIDSL